MSGNAERHAEPEPVGQDSRQFRRKKSLLPATLITARGSFDCRVLDFSGSGAKVECTQSLDEGDGLTLTVEAIGTFRGTVVWRGEGCFGVRFIGPLSELLSEIKDLRSDFERATKVTSELTTELLFRAYLVFQQAAQDNATADALRGEVKRLGLKPSCRSRLQHLAVDIAFPRTKVSPSLRTLYSKAIVGGHLREFTAQQFREAVQTGSSGKGGINELAGPLQDTSRTEPKVTVAEAQAAHILPEFEPVDAAAPPSNEEYDRTNGRECNFEVISLSESLRKRLTSEDLVDGAEFMVVVNVIGANELRAVEYLGPCHRASAFLPESASPSADFNAPACSQPDALTGPTACSNAASKEASASVAHSQPIPPLMLPVSPQQSKRGISDGRGLSDFVMGLFRVS